MNYKKCLENDLGIKLEENKYTKRKYLNYLDSLKHHADVLIPSDEVIKKIDANDFGFVVEYAISLCGGDSSDVSADEIDLFVKRINNGYNLVKYIEEVKK